MPYQSDAQRRWAHTDAGEKALGGPSKVAEWDRASKGMKLPERKSTVAMTKGHVPHDAQYAAGGPVLGRTLSFAKDQFTGGRMPVKEEAPVKQDYARKGGPAKRAGDKSEKPVLPRR